ncbi:MAG TPA: VCBS repeat-containing protein, partial [Methylomirabilota bacterium]|nr:VCBS repeat-containing protein [Methylomirabilota bacterium]
DFNGDGKPDLVWQNDATRQVSVWYLGGAGGNVVLGENWLTSIGVPGWSVVGSSDFNGDGKPDLVWQNDATRQVGVWYMGGAGGNVVLGSNWLTSIGVPGWRATAR